MKKRTIKQMVLGLMLCAAQGMNAQALDPNILKYLSTIDTIYTEHMRLFLGRKTAFMQVCRCHSSPS